MSRPRVFPRTLTRSLVAATVLAASVLLVASPASATALATKAQVSGDSLLIEGRPASGTPPSPWTASS